MLPPSTRLGPYEILESIGTGGMGEVYRARDPRLGREVALKVLPAEFGADPERRDRFEREARAVAALSHSNILAIHDVGAEGAVSYLVMELLEGETLRARLGRGRLPVRKAVEIGADLADGLAAAHTRGIVHRDIKPENVFLTRGGQVKILDFGLARLEAASNAGTRTAAGTMPGVAMGTAGYMAPEQVRGQAVDARSDIFALGCVLAEMVTGRQTFGRETMAETFAAILHEEAAGLRDSSVSLPRSLEAIIRRCLEKDPADRFQSTSDLPFALRASVDDLAGAPASGVPHLPRWIGPAAALLLLAGLAITALWLRSGVAGGEPIRSVAVLPFENLGGDSAADYLSDGLADHIINGLAAVRGDHLRVRPFASVARYRGTLIEAPVVARELNVDALVLGSLRQHGDALAISVALVDARENTQIWGKRYQGTLGNILGLQDQFATDVAAHLRLRLTDEEARTLVRRDTEDAEAYLLYRQGVHEFNRFSAEGLEAAREYFLRATQRDPLYVSALAGIARCYILLGSLHLGPRVTYPEAGRIIARGRSIDPDHGELRAQQGVIYLFHDWNWEGARQAFEPAFARAPELLFPTHNLQGFLLAASGQPEEAMAAIRRGNEVEPLSAPRRAELAQALIWLRDYDGAIDESRRALELEPRFMLAFQHLGTALLQKGRLDEALATFEQGLRVAPQNAALRGGSGVVHARAGRHTAAAAVVDDLAGWPSRANLAYAIARIHAALGQHDEALVWLRRSAENRDSFVIWVRLDPIFDSLKADPRFDDFVREVGLPS